MVYFDDCFCTFCNWFISLNVIASRVTHVAGFSFFLRLDSISFYVHTIFCLSTYLSMDMDCFCLLATVINAAVDTGVDISV